MEGDIIHLDKHRFRKDPIKQLLIEYNRFEKQAEELDKTIEYLKSETRQTSVDMYKQFLIRRISEEI